MPAWNLRLRDRDRGLVDLHPVGREIVRGLDRIAIRHLLHVQARDLEPSGEIEPQRAGDAGPVELAGLGLGVLHQVLHRIDVGELGRHRDADDGVGHARDRREVGGLIRPVLVHPGMRDERRRRRQQQDVVVLGADECADRDDAVAAGLVLDHHRLAPLFGRAGRPEAARRCRSRCPRPSVRMKRTGRCGQACDLSLR